MGLLDFARGAVGDLFSGAGELAQQHLGEALPQVEEVLGSISGGAGETVEYVQDRAGDILPQAGDVMEQAGGAMQGVGDAISETLGSGDVLGQLQEGVADNLLGGLSDHISSLFKG